MHRTTYFLRLPCIAVLAEFVLRQLHGCLLGFMFVRQSLINVIGVEVTSNTSHVLCEPPSVAVSRELVAMLYLVTF